jgi:two-component system, NarL family, nitrate/nitrite sensor histidine kinase NarX
MGERLLVCRGWKESSTIRVVFIAVDLTWKIITSPFPPSAWRTKRAGDTDRGDRLPVIEVLAEIASSMSSDANTEQMLMRFLEIMVRISRAKAGAVRVLTADGAHLRMVGSIGLSPALVEKERYVPLECGICGKATLSQASQSDSVMEVCQKQVRHIYFAQQCSTVYAVPLRHKGKVLGVYNIFLDNPAPLPEDIRYLFNSISEHLGMALETPA